MPKITRREAGNCCDWCKEVVGTYAYPNIPEKIYRRNRYCRCTVEYNPVDGKRQDVHTKQWKDPDKDVKMEVRKVSSKLPKVLRKDSINTKNFKRGSGKNYPIRFVGSDYVKFDSEIIDKVTIIAGKGVITPIKESIRLENSYNQPASRWEKISGLTYIKYKGNRLNAEIHWYEANGKRYEIKVKRVIKNES